MSIEYGIIILAAGGSQRLGRPKQLLHYKGKSLLQNVIDAACTVPRTQTIVVLGSHKEQIQAELSSVHVDIVYNPDWKTGMASSITSGLKALIQKHPDVRACVLAVCDQPFVNSGILAELVLLHENSGNSIVASTYEGTVGTPALFNRRFFPELLALTGDEGAKKIIAAHPQEMALAPFELGKIDIDTEKDYQRLQSHTNP